MRDLYISLHSASTDNTIKVLTLVATIFLPLTLLAGIYGMNFSPGFFQPGSSDPVGFYVMILAMFVTSPGLIYLFKRSGWIQARASFLLDCSKGFLENLHTFR